MQGRKTHEPPVTKPGNSQATQQPAELPGWPVRFVRGTAVALGLGAIFAWLGVYNTSVIPPLERFAYWAGLMGLGLASAAIVNPLIFDRWMKESHPALKIGVVALAISVPITSGLIVIETVSGGTLPSFERWWVQFFYVVIISALLTTGGWAVDLLIDQKAEAQSSSPGAPADAAASAFADRLPAKFRSADILAVSAEDHYLRVHTSAGETMILMRLADAIRELAAIEGMQVHRSWWVAKQGLDGLAKGDGKVALKLKSGAEAPVSRTYQKAVKDAGWI